MAAQRLPVFRGRASERAALDRLLETARRGRSGVLNIRGEAGVGKTALLAYCVQQAHDFRVLQSVGIESEMELAFAGLHQLCSPLLLDVEGIPAPQARALTVALGLEGGERPDRFFVALAVLSLFAEVAEKRPLLCVVDDANWLDRASAQVLGFVARRLLAEPVALLFAVREPSDDLELTGLPEMALRGLEEDDARALLATVIPGRLDERVRERIVIETRGNPLALLELARAALTATDLAGGFGLPAVGGTPARIEESYLRRARELPASTQRLILLAAADPVGDAALVWRAAQTLGIGADALPPAEAEDLLHIGANVRFRHPLVRSAVYRGSSEDARRAAHAALAGATDSELEPDTRAWHRAQAASAPDAEVADELIRSADSAERRGGIAAAAAFLARAVALTPDPAGRASRALAAATAKFASADLEAAKALLASADAGPLDELSAALVQRTRAQIAFELRRGSDAPPLLLRAAERLRPLDRELACETFLEALVAAIYAGRLASGSDIAEIAFAARCGHVEGKPECTNQLMLSGLASRFTEGYAAAAPTIKRALRARLDEPQPLDWSWLAYNIAAMDAWDDNAWFELASRQAQLARESGAISMLPYALDYLAGYHIQAGELSQAAALMSEAEGLQVGIREPTLPYIPLQLAAWRGEATSAQMLITAMNEGASERGEGCAITVAEHATAILYNGLGEYELAVGGARNAAWAGEAGTSSWAASELVEAATRVGNRELALQAFERLSGATAASGTEWAKGVQARSRAFLEEDDAAEKLHREAIALLARSRMKAQLVRAQLSYGEWLRREGRRIDSREQLHFAHAAFSSMGAEGFAERARRELVATGEKVRKRRDDTRDDLTPQEEQIARLACEGLTNREIGAQLFISPRTVEWHLHNVFTKLGIRSRRGLKGALQGREAHIL
jgi:DNA-binding CsgD family transcriptional regulator